MGRRRYSAGAAIHGAQCADAGDRDDLVERTAGSPCGRAACGFALFHQTVRSGIIPATRRTRARRTSEAEAGVSRRERGVIPAETARSTPPDFLAGGGEMGERIRNFDWSTHPLGKPDLWPQSLKT